MFQINNLTITPRVAALGERVNVSFDLTTEWMLEGMLALQCPGLKQAILIRDSDWQQGAYTTEHITTSVDIESLDGSLEATLSTTRAVAETAWTVSAYNTVGAPETVEIPNPVTYINVRCSPSIDSLDLERSSSGEPDDSGVFLMVDGKLSLSKNADLSSMKLVMYYAENATADTTSSSIVLTSAIPALLSGVTDSTDIVTAAFSNASAWNFLFVFGDEYESVSLRRNIFKAFANLHLSGLPTGGVCMGGFSTSKRDEPKFECHYPAYFYGGIEIGGVKDYSSEEISTGVKWTNGKPIYRRTISGTVAQAGAFVTIGTIGSLEQVVNISGGILTTAGMYVPVNTYFNSSYWFSCFVGLTGAGSIDCVSTAGYLGTAVITIEYTKSTDTETFVEFYDADESAVYDADNNAVAVVSEGLPVYHSRFTGSQIDEGIERARMMTALPGVTEADNGKVLTVVNGAWAAADLPKYDGEYSVTPAVEEQTLLTSQKYLDANLRIEKIPYSEVTNTANGTTVTIG